MKTLGTLEHWAYQAALILGLAVAARFGWSLTQVSAQRAAAADRDRFAHQSGSPHPALPPLVGLAQPGAQMATPEAITSAIAAAVGTAPVSSSSNHPVSPPREIISSYLSVQAGAPRSELRVNGTLVGKTPFLGQISCERGQTVRLDLLPPKGLPGHYEIPCLAGEMRLRDEP